MKTNLFLVFSILISSVLLSASEETKEVIITGNDAMQFDVKKFQISPSESVRLTFKNIGSIPKIAMGHNLVILKKDVDALAFGQKVLASGGSATNALPKSLLGEVIAHSDLLGPGESETIEFNAPKEKGDYQYVCTFPGHFAMMRGIMEVR
jgi:azurin